MIASISVIPALTIQCFGRMSVTVAGAPMPRLRSRKALWLLALLALRHGRPVEREWLAGTLWPEMDQSQAYANLRPVLSDLRRALGDEGDRLLSPSRHTLCLNLEDAEIDVLLFDNAVASRDLSRLERAVSLYQGALLADCDDEWARPERTERETNFRHALQTLAETATTRHDYSSAAKYYRRAIAVAPWWDTAQRGLMEALAQDGDRNAALDVYRKFVDLLKSDPKAAPDAKTTALYTRLRKETQRQGVARPESAPALAATVGGEPPAPQSEMIGREDDRADVAAKLRRSRLVTLTGLGGVGKTRLAASVAADVAAEYPDGVWFTPLETAAGEQIAVRIGEALGIVPTGRSPLERLTDHLRKKQALLVLDGCEHILTACAHAAGHLLRQCAGVRILVASREPLGITGEALCETLPLAAPTCDRLPDDPGAQIQALLGYDSVQLLIARAQALQPEFELTWSNAATVARLSAQLEGVPLAIELAATQLSAMTLEQISARLHNHLAAPAESDAQTRSGRQTLHGTLDWSFALLSAPEHRLITRLAVFAGGWTLEAAETVCSGGEVKAEQVLDQITSLAEKSLVVFEERAGAGRFRMMEIVRQCALKKLLDSGEWDLMRDRHQRWFAALVHEEKLRALGSEPEPAMQALETEHANIYTALDGDDIEASLGMLDVLWRFWLIRSDFGEGRRRVEAVLGRPGTENFPAARAAALRGAGFLAARRGDYSAARQHHEESRSLCRSLEDEPGMAASLLGLGEAVCSLGDIEAAHALYRESLASLIAIGDNAGVSDALRGISAVMLAQSQAQAAACTLGVAEAIHEQMGSAIPLSEQWRHDTLSRQAHAALGEDAYDAAWRTGRSMTLKQAREYARSQAGVPSL